MRMGGQTTMMISKVWQQVASHTLRYRTLLHINKSACDRMCCTITIFVGGGEVVWSRWVGQQASEVEGNNCMGKTATVSKQ